MSTGYGHDCRLYRGLHMLTRSAQPSDLRLSGATGNDDELVVRECPPEYARERKGVLPIHARSHGFAHPADVGEVEEADMR